MFGGRFNLKTELHEKTNGNASAGKEKKGDIVFLLAKAV
jgi:hypothetical protein